MKHLPYFHVLDALKQAASCPLCELERDAVHGYLDALLYESVNDPGVRARLADSRGYCCRHAHALLAIGRGAGTAILYHDQVRLFRGFVDKLDAAASKRSSRRPGREWDRHAVCPACRLQLQTRDRSISVLLQGLAEDEMRQAFEASPPLCAPHFVAALEAAKSPEQRRCLIAVQKDKLDDLLHDLEEFSRKQDYRFSREAYGRERDAWKRAVMTMAGLREVF